MESEHKYSGRGLTCTVQVDVFVVTCPVKKKKKKKKKKSADGGAAFESALKHTRMRGNGFIIIVINFSFNSG